MLQGIGFRIKAIFIFSSDVIIVIIRIVYLSDPVSGENGNKIEI